MQGLPLAPRSAVGGLASGAGEADFRYRRMSLIIFGTSPTPLKSNIIA
jgi:hypothetical protein